MHLAACVIERGDAEEVVVPTLAVMVLLHLGRRHQAAVIVQYGLGEAGGARGEIDRPVVPLGDLDGGWLGRTTEHHLAVALGERGAVGSYEEAGVESGHPIDDGLHSAHELGPKDQRTGLGELETVLDLLRGVAIVHRYRHRPGLEDAEVDREPLQAVHEEDRHLVASADAPAQEQVGEAVGALFKEPPGDLAPGVFVRVRLHELVLPPGDLALLFHLGVDADQTHLVAVECGVARE